MQKLTPQEREREKEEEDEVGYSDLKKWINKERRKERKNGNEDEYV